MPGPLNARRRVRRRAKQSSAEDLADIQRRISGERGQSLSVSGEGAAEDAQLAYIPQMITNERQHGNYGQPDANRSSMTGNHPRLSTGQRALATGVAVLTLADAPVFFVVMFVTVNDLLGPYFNGWAWTVPVATEISFTILFLLGVLFTWADRAPGWLLLAPYPFALASLALNVYGAHGNIPAMIGHAVVTVAFFLPLIAVKAAVRRFAASDEARRRDQAVTDAIAHARDILRAADRWWRFRAPLLLRRQLRSRRLPAAVLDAIEQGVMFGGATKWEPAVEAWITRSLVLPETVSAQLSAAREAAIQSVPVVPARSAPADVPAVTPEAPAEPAADASRNDPASTPQRVRKPRRIVVARATDEELAELVLPLFDGDAEVKKYGVIKAIREQSAGGKGIGDERAGKVLEIASRMHRERVVVPFGAAR